MQTEFTSINSDNEDIGMIKLVCVSHQMMGNHGQNWDRSDTKLYVFGTDLFLSLLMCDSSVLLCPPPVFVAQI